ncbi:limbic system-associated membrane protein-like [Porites lutea]|uniref:limbic system-associated membrane protein-like n=1 Tax=Porites lutea TaxID=51062 RepID=UPI003CC5A0F8
MLSSSSKPTNESIVKVPKDHQNAFYRCQASNFLGDDWQILRFVRLMAPVIVEPKEGEAPLLLKIGYSLNISCVAKGNPAPNVTWLNNNTGNAVSPTSTNSQRLIINSIEDKDFGFYTCIASSKLNYTMVSVEIKKVFGVFP